LPTLKTLVNSLRLDAVRRTGDSGGVSIQRPFPSLCAADEEARYCGTETRRASVAVRFGPLTAAIESLDHLLKS